MAYYVIFDSTANMVDSFDTEQEAREALDAIAQADPDEAAECAVLSYDDQGQPIGEAHTGAELLHC